MARSQNIKQITLKDIAASSCRKRLPAVPELPGSDLPVRSLSVLLLALLAFAMVSVGALLLAF